MKMQRRRVVKKKYNKKNGGGALSVKEELFVKEYLKDFNATRAYMKVYSNVQSCGSASVQSCKLIRNNRIKFEIDKQIRERMKRLDIRNDSIVAQLRDIVFMDVRELIDNSGNFKNIKDLNVAQQAMIKVKEVRDKRYKNGFKIEIELCDRLKAKEMLMKYFGMLIEKHQHDISQNLTLRFEVEKLKNLDKEELIGLRDILARARTSAIVGASGYGSGGNEFN